MTDRNTPTPSNSVVTEAMIEAGDTVLRRADFSFWEKMDEAEGHALIRSIYLAMQSANTTGSDELVAKVAYAIDAQAQMYDILLDGEEYAFARAAINAIQGIAIDTPDTDRVAVLTEALRNSRAWIFECWGWLMETDLDMTCPMQTDPLDVVEQIDALLGIDAALSQPLGSQGR